jgi:hypothetical protein
VHRVRNHMRFMFNRDFWRCSVAGNFGHWSSVAPKLQGQRMPRNVVFGALRQQPCESMTMPHDATAFYDPNGIYVIWI